MSPAVAQAVAIFALIFVTAVVIFEKSQAERSPIFATFSASRHLRYVFRYVFLNFRSPVTSVGGDRNDDERDGQEQLRS